MAGLFSSATLEQVRAANDIVEVIGAALPLKRAGGNFVALCPFHKERTPSFNVNPQRQIFHCFGCHKGGDVFRFIQEYESLSFPEAVKRLADRAKIPIETSSDASAGESRSLKDALLEIHEQIALRWQAALNQDAGGEAARQYLARRKVPAEAVQLFRLGYAPEAWDDTVNWAKSKRFELELVERAGLIVRKETPEQVRFYDRFRGRLMFPICDEQGRIIAFSGRILAGDQKTAKYVNSPETPIFTKGRVFYGLDKSKRALLDAQFAVICEGQLDLIACYMGGVQNVVAPQGTAFTAEHARILKRYVDEVVLCFDSDTAGQTAAVRVFDSLLASGLAIRVATVPAPHDPDSFIKEQGSAAFQKLIQDAPGFFDYYLERLCATNDTRSDRGQVAVSRAMAEALHKTGSSVLLDRYAQKTALRLNVAAEAIRLEFKKASGTARAHAATDREDAPQVPSEERPPSAQEFWLLKILLLHDESVDWLQAHLDPVWVQHSGVRRVIELRFAAQEEHLWHGPAALVSQVEEEALHTLLTQVLAEEKLPLNPEQQRGDIVLKLRNYAFDQEMAVLLRRLGTPGVSDEEHVALLRRQMELRAARLKPLSPR